jgi:hypothetical protein
MHWSEKKYIIFVENPEGKRPLAKDPVIDGR